MTSFAPRKDGKEQPTTVFTYKRIAGDGKPYAFIGTWKGDPKLTKWGEEPVPMIISDENGVLTMSNPVSDVKTIIDLNKSEMKVTGASNPPADVRWSAKRIDAKSFQTDTTRADRTFTAVYTVSSDGKTLTVRRTSPGDDGKPVVVTSVYERQ
jgi:hypothetical protein